MNIENIDTIRREAKAAAAAGITPEDACRWPFSSGEGWYFLDEYRMHKAALIALGLDDKPLTTD